MGTELGDFVQIIDKQLYLGEEIMNVYHYRYIVISPATSDIYSALADWFEDNVISNVINLQSESLTHTAIEIKNLTNQLDIFTKSVDIDGVVDVDAGENSPSFVAVGFILRRESAATRNGAKRISGIPDGGISGNAPNYNPTVISALQDVFASDVVLGVLPSFEPVILRKPAIPGDPPTTYASIGSAQMRPTMSSQNTRKA